MTNAVKIKTSGTPGKVPTFTDIPEPGRFCWNERDGKLYGRTTDGVTDYIVDLSLIPTSDVVFTNTDRILSSDSSGDSVELSASSARTLLNVADGADATNFLGAKTSAQRDALSPSAGDWIKNSSVEYGYRLEVYNGSFWVSPTDVLMANRTGSNSVKGKPVKTFTAASASFKNISSLGDDEVIGVCSVSGITNGEYTPITMFGKAQCLFDQNESLSPGDPVYVLSNGLCGKAPDFGTSGVFATCLIATPSSPSSDYSLTCLLHSTNRESVDLNVSNDLSVGGFTQLGNSPGIKVQRYTGTTPSSQGQTLYISSDIAPNKILSIAGMIYGTDWGVPMNNLKSGFECNVEKSSTTQIAVTLSASNSGSVTDKSISVTIIYTE